MKGPKDEWPTVITSCNEHEVEKEARKNYKLCGSTLICLTDHHESKSKTDTKVL